MAVVVCPWCQSEIPYEEGEEPDKYCPVCENEIGGYRTLTIGMDEDDDDDEEAHEPAARADEDDLSWIPDDELNEKNEALLQFEETVEGLLDEQDNVPECPSCREYMLEAGEVKMTADSFKARTPESLGQTVLDAPFAITVYVCPSCFTVQQSLSEDGRVQIARRLSDRAASGRKAAKS